MEKNSISIIHGKYNYSYVIRHSPYTRKYSPNKHTI
jgi:hypothetical protein